MPSVIFTALPRPKRVRSSWFKWFKPTSSHLSPSSPTPEFPYADESPYWVYVIQCKTPNRIQVGMTCDLPRRIEEHRRGESGSPTIVWHGFKGVIETLPVSTREAAFVLERATVLRYLQQGYIATGGGIGEKRAEQARNEYILLKMGFRLKRKRSIWVKRPPRQRLRLEVRRERRRLKKQLAAEKARRFPQEARSGQTASQPSPKGFSP